MEYAGFQVPPQAVLSVKTLWFTTMSWSLLPLAKFKPSLMAQAISMSIPPKAPWGYNGIISWDAYERGAGDQVVGMGPHGVEHIAEFGFVCRLVVLDAVAYRKSQGKLSAAAEMLPVPSNLATLASLPPMMSKPS
jgi:hypothetical protein